MWLLFAFSAPILWAASTHIDKYMVERFFKQNGVATLMVFTALMSLVPLSLIAIFCPGLGSVPRLSAVVIIASGMLYMAAMFLYLRALQSEEASVVAPFYQATPVFGFVLAYFVLGEKLSSRQMVGGFLIVLGTFLASTKFASDKKHFNYRLIALMLGCAFALAVASIIFKMFAVREDFWPTIFWTFVGEASFGVTLLLAPRCWRQFVQSLKGNSKALLTINGVNELINFAGSLGARYAMVLAPRGLVQAISSTTSLFVFTFGVALTVFAPSLGREDLAPGNLARKGISAGLVAIGVIIIGNTSAGTQPYAAATL